jgi:hypothetical protein
MASAPKRTAKIICLFHTAKLFLKNIRGPERGRDDCEMNDDIPACGRQAID